LCYDWEPNQLIRILTAGINTRKPKEGNVDQRNWTIIAIIVVVVLVVGYLVWPAAEEPAATDTSTTTEETAE